MKNVARIRKLIKKILRTICIWGIISMMLIPTMALDNIETMPLHNYVAMTWSSESSTQGSVLAYDALPRTIPGANANPKLRGVMFYQSALDKNTFYHIRIKMQASNAQSIAWLEETPTGVITQAGGSAYTVMLPANALSPYTQSIEESYNAGTYKPIMMSWETMSLYKITSYVGAKVYYYFTRGNNGEFTVDAIMYFNDEFFNYGWNFEASSTRYMQCYLGIFMPMTGGIQLLDAEVYQVGGNDYNGKLDQIIALLQSQGGGLTEEDIKHATVEALRQHEQEEQQQAQQGTQDAQEQAEQAMARYTAVMEQMKTAMAGIEDIKNIDTSTYTLTIGPFTNPMTGGVFPAVGVDFYTAYQGMPAILKSTCPIVVTFFVLMAYAREFLDVFKHVEKTMHGEDE